MDSLHLVKYHGLGNDFLILIDLEDLQPVDGSAARALCDRHRGVGADGLIRLGPGLRMELFNADGGRAQTSGNGLRCVARAVADAGLVDRDEMVVVETDAGPCRATLLADGRVTVEMGHPVVNGTRVDVGNPHLVVPVESLDGIDLEAEASDHPDVNVEVVAPGPGPDTLVMRVWERGVGETSSCGSGSVAVAAVAWAAGQVGDRVTVHQPGGSLVVELSNGAATLTGPAEYICTVEVPRPSGGEREDPRPSGGEREDPRPSGGEREDTRPSGGEREDPRPSGGEREVPWPS